MTMVRKATLLAALPLVVGLWLTPPAAAEESQWRQTQRPAWSSSSPHHRRWDAGRYQGRYDRGRHDYGRSGAYGEDSYKYAKAMRRLARQERDARAKAYRKYDGDRHDPRLRERLGAIDRKYEHKRDKVERNWGR